MSLVTAQLGHTLPSSPEAGRWRDAGGIATGSVIADGNKAAGSAASGGMISGVTITP